MILIAIYVIQKQGPTSLVVAILRPFCMYEGEIKSVSRFLA